MTTAANDAAGMTFDERIALLEKFERLRALKATCRVEHAMAVLDCARSTIYANRRLMAKRVRRGGRGIGFRCDDVLEEQRLRGGKR